MSSWYRTGTVSVQNGSRIVIGTGTAWNAGAKVSEGLKGPDGQLYEIESINSDVQITLATAYLGGTAAGQTYVIVPTQSYLRELAKDVEELINEFGGVVDGAGAGKFAPGTVGAPTIRAWSDEDTGMNMPGGNIIQLGTGGVTRLRLGDDGTTQAQAQCGFAAWTDRTATGASQASLIVRERYATGAQNSDPMAAPRLSVYWSGVFGGQISCDGQGFKLLDDPGTGLAPIRTGTHSITGQLAIASGANQWFGIGAGSVPASSGVFYRGGTTTPVGYIGTDGGALIGAGAGNNFVVRAEGDLLLNSQGGTVRPTGYGDTRLGSGGFPWSEVNAVNAILTGVLSAGLPAASYHRIGAAVTEGTAILEVARASYAGVAFFASNGGYGSGSAATMALGANSTTGRSIKAAGTINASGADYAEYHGKAERSGNITKGQILGIDADDKVTDKWSDAITYGIKSTDPSYVGGDSWASHLTPPDEPTFVPSEYTPTPPPVPADFVEPVEPVLPAEPTLPTRPPGISDEQWLLYRMGHEVAMREFTTLVMARASVVTDARSAYEIEKRTKRDTFMERQKAEHAALVAQEKAAFEAGPLAKYRQARAAFDAELEAARQTVDRVAYSGRVPVNVQGAVVGDYIVAAEGPNDTIVGQVVSASDMRADMSQYLAVVGRVRAILPDGRATCAVVIH